MSDYSELNARASAAIPYNSNWPCQLELETIFGWAVAGFMAHATPMTVSRLISENKELVSERDHLKAENASSTEREILQLAEIDALRKDADRYRKIRQGAIHDEDDAGIYILDQRGEKYQECAVTIRDDELDAAIDAAINKIP